MYNGERVGHKVTSIEFNVPLLARLLLGHILEDL